MQISGAWSAELPTERLARLVAADVIEHLGRPEVLDALGAAIAGRLEATGPAEPGGYAIGGHGGPGAEHYDREGDR